MLDSLHRKASSGEKSQQWHRAPGLLEEMRLSGIAADTITCNTTMSACEKNQHWHRALGLLEEIP